MEQTLPTNIEAEESILGGILLDPNAMSRIENILNPHAFYVKAHQQIYQAALELYQKQQPTDLMTVTTWLSDHKLIDKIGGASKLAQLINRTVSAVNIDRYAELVMDKYNRRQLIKTGYELVELGHDTTTDLEDIFQSSEQKIYELTKTQTDRFEPVSIHECLQAVFKELEKGQNPGYTTGLLDLDTMIGGLLRQDLIVIAARASMGKTWLACHLAQQILVKQQFPVVFFSAEMSRSLLTKRFIAMLSGIDCQRLIQNKIYRQEYNALVESLGHLSEYPLIIDDTPSGMQTPSRMRSALRRIASERGQLGLVILDYIQKLGDRGARNRAQAIGAFSGAFKDIAKEFDVPFVCLAQINRAVEGQSNKRPFMSDIKDSGDIEQDMDIGLLLYRDEYYNPDSPDQGVMEINVAKNRNGGTGTVKVLFEPSIGKFCQAQDFEGREAVL